ncbi:MAG: rod shape-determining protein MreD [Fibrobacterota bacterium]
MRRFITWIVYFSIAMVLQSTIISQISIHGIHPNAVLIVLFILSIEYGKCAGIWSGFFVGLIIDLYSGGILGVQALANTVVGGFVGLFSRRRLNPGPVFQILILFIASIIHNFIYYLVETEGITSFEIIYTSIPSALYTAILSAILLFAGHYFIPSRRR